MPSVLQGLFSNYSLSLTYKLTKAVRPDPGRRAREWRGGRKMCNFCRSWARGGVAVAFRRAAALVCVLRLPLPFPLPISFCSGAGRHFWYVGVAVNSCLASRTGVHQILGKIKLLWGEIEVQGKQSSTYSCCGQSVTEEPCGAGHKLGRCCNVFPGHRVNWDVPSLQVSIRHFLLFKFVR